MLSFNSHVFIFHSFIPRSYTGDEKKRMSIKRITFFITKNGDKNVIKNTILFKNVGIKNTKFWKTHFCFNGKHEIQNWQRWKIKIILLFNRNGEWYWNEISFSINNEIYSINSFCFVLHFYISISNSFIQLYEQLISIMKWVLCCFIQQQKSFWLNWK